MPTQAVESCFAQDTFILAQLGENGLGVGAEGGRGVCQELNESADGAQAVVGLKPLWLREMAHPFGIARALLEKKSHRVFVSGKEIEKRAHVQTGGQLFQRVFVAGHCLTVDKDVESGVFAFDDDIETCSHRFEFSGDSGVDKGKVGGGHPSITGEGCPIWLLWFTLRFQL